jgi:hypothetical protein
LAGVIAEAGGPATFSVAREVVARGLLFRQCVTNDAPVDEIFGVQDGESGSALEAGGGHVVVVADADDVGVGVVGVNDRIAIGSVTVVGAPDEMLVLIGSTALENAKRESEGEEGASEHRRSMKEEGRKQK